MPCCARSSSRPFCRRQCWRRVRAWHGRIRAIRWWGRIADLILEQHPATRDKVRLLLEGASLSDAAIWADCAKDAEAFCGRPPSQDELTFVRDNKDHRAFHYTDVPVQQTQYILGTAGTAHNDAVQIIRYAIRVLSNAAPEPGPANLDKKRSIWLLAHLVGDIHQPLHVGALFYDRKCQAKVDPNEYGAFHPEFGLGKTGLVAETVGGNALLLTPWNNPFNNLHIFWDRTTVVDAMQAAGVPDQSVNAFAQEIERIRQSDGKRRAPSMAGRIAGPTKSCRSQKKRSTASPSTKAFRWSRTSRIASGRRAMTRPTASGRRNRRAFSSARPGSALPSCYARSSKNSSDRRTLRPTLGARVTARRRRGSLPYLGFGTNESRPPGLSTT